MSDPLYWRLAYPDDHVEDEPDDNASILFSRPGAVRLFAMRPDGKGGRGPVFAIWLVDEETGQTYKPIFYRRRSMGIAEQKSQLEVTVVGRGTTEINSLTRAERRRIEKHHATMQYDGSLWASYDGQRFIDAPPEVIDEAAIAHLLTAAV